MVKTANGWAVLLGLVVVLGCAAPAPSPSAAPIATIQPQTAPLLPALPAGTLPVDVTTALQAVLDRRIKDRPDEPSVSAAVIEPEGGTWAGAAGVADTKAGQPATSDTVYAAASITKLFVAALALKLVDDGVIGLDDLAAKWLPEAAKAKSNGATVSQLLAHRSGIASYTEGDPAQLQSQPRTPDQLLDLIGPPYFTAGAQEEYSNSNYLLLGLMVEKAGGATLETQLRQRILGPLALTRTYQSGREQVPPPLAHGYGRATSLTGDLYDGSGDLPNKNMAVNAWAAGAMASTPTDVARFLYLLANGGVVSQGLTARILQYNTVDTYGLVFERGSFPNAGLALGHVGAIPGYVALAFYMVDSGNVVVVATNTDVDDLYLVVLDLNNAARHT